MNGEKIISSPCGQPYLNFASREGAKSERSGSGSRRLTCGPCGRSRRPRFGRNDDCHRRAFNERGAPEDRSGSARLLRTGWGKPEELPGYGFWNTEPCGWSEVVFGLPLRIENDAALALLGEHRAGAARGFGDVVLVTLGTGIGVSAMLEHRLIRSRMGHAGSLGGHFTLKMDGRRCACGTIGCAEAEASTSVLPAIAAAWPGFAESELAASTRLDYAEVFRAKEAGDRVAREIVDHSIAVWSALAATLVHAYGPQVILFGGGVMARGEEILGPVRAYVQRHAWRSSRGVTQIESAALGTHAAYVGAEALFEEGYV
jgi:predicted NBD/HSP70 family sugar kinase